MKAGRLIKKILDRWNNGYHLKKYQVSYGKDLQIRGKIKIYGNKGRITLGDHLTINSGKGLIPIGFEENCTFWVMENGRIRVGDHCGFTNAAICSAECVEIGNHVLLGGGVKIYDTDFHSLNHEIRRDLVHDHDRRTKKVKIEDDVFVGAGTIILKGSTIGKRSIIGAGSVVSGVIPPGQIWGGNPAKYIRDIE